MSFEHAMVLLLFFVVGRLCSHSGVVFDRCSVDPFQPLNNWCKPSNKKDLCLVKLWIPWRLPFVQWTPVAEVVWKRVIWVSGVVVGVRVVDQ